MAIYKPGENGDGFCPGADKAVSLLSSTLDGSSKTYLTSEILHNSIVNKYFEKEGVIVKELPEREGDEDEVVIFPPHGVEKEKKEIWEKNYYSTVDATCTFVEKNIQFLKECESDVVIIGKKNHQEVKTLLSYRECPVLESDADLLFLDKNKSWSAVVQTTFDPYVLSEIKKTIKERSYNFTFLTDLCPYMKARLDFIRRCSGRTDIYIIVGDETSSNANCLLRKAKKMNKMSVLVQDENDFDERDRRYLGNYNVMIVPATSTPKEVVDKIYEKLSLPWVLTKKEKEEYNVALTGDSSAMEKELDVEEEKEWIARSKFALELERQEKLKEKRYGLF